MNIEEFEKFIESIGFKYNVYSYLYKEYIIDLYEYTYEFYNGSGWVGYDYNDLSPLEKEFKKELRSVKLKELLR